MIFNLYPNKEAPGFIFGKKFNKVSHPHVFVDKIEISHVPSQSTWDWF